MRNPAIDVDDIAIFDNPPLTQMSKLDYHTSNYVASDTIRPKNAPPLASADSHWWQILTFCNSPGRALQIATECFTTGQKNGRMFLRTRHVDNDDFTQWQAWKEVATCYCADLEWKALPFMNGFVDATTDSRHPAKYRKGSSGDVVYVKGLIKHNSGTIPQRTYFAQLPEGYRPKEYVWYQICSVNGGFHNWRCVVETDGRLMVENWSKEISGSDLILSVNLAIPI